MNTRHELIAQLYTVAAEMLPDAYGQWAVGELARCHDIAGLEWTLSAESSLYRSGLIARLEGGAGPDEPVVYQQVLEVMVDGARHVFRLPGAGNHAPADRDFHTGLFHAATAWSLCRRYSIAGRMDGTGADTELGYAIVHATGEVKVCDSRFSQLLAGAGWTGLGALSDSLECPRGEAGILLELPVFPGDTGSSGVSSRGAAGSPGHGQRD